MPIYFPIAIFIFTIFTRFLVSKIKFQSLLSICYINFKLSFQRITFTYELRIVIQDVVHDRQRSREIGYNSIYSAAVSNWKAGSLHMRFRYNPFKSNYRIKIFLHNNTYYMIVFNVCALKKHYMELDVHLDYERVNAVDRNSNL